MCAYQEWKRGKHTSKNQNSSWDNEMMLHQSHMTWEVCAVDLGGYKMETSILKLDAMKITEILQNKWISK